MSEDPYRILGVKRGASLAMIKAAFRRQAQANHPDRHAGKSPEEQNAHAQQFQRARWAHDVLSDAAQRAYYDRHGYSRDQAPRLPAEVQTTLVDCFRHVVDATRDYRHNDIIRLMRLALTDQMEEARSRAQAARRAIETLREIEGRLLNREDPDNLLAEALAEDLTKLEGAREGAERKAAHFRLCVDELQHWRYRTGGEPGYVDESRSLEEVSR